MFIRIDKDLSVNINKIFSYKLSEDQDSYKLQIWGESPVPMHTIIYPKSRPDLVNLLIDFNNAMRDLTVNNEIIESYITEVNESNNTNQEENSPRHIEEEFVVEE